MMPRVELYSPDRASVWNEFLSHSRNGTFLFLREYMDYHASRFIDFSLMFYYKQRLVALFPANRQGSHLYSHKGLSYGGLIMSNGLTAAVVCDIFTVMNDFLRTSGISCVTYKPVPHIYSLLPCDEPLYALNLVCHATMVGRDLASVVRRGEGALRLAELRRRGMRKALSIGLTVGLSYDYASFWTILQDNLAIKYNARPVHTLDEITLLSSRFPDNIKLYAVFEHGVMIAGTVLYITPQVVKTQYISASPRGKATGALDLLFSQIISDTTFSQPYLDMGTSALANGKNGELNLSLISQKEGFGGRGVCYDTYEWEL